jgi:hypothetical protein
LSNAAYCVLGNDYIWLTKVLKILMQRTKLLVCSLAMPTYSQVGLPLWSRNRGSGLRRRLCLVVLYGTLGTLI